MNKQLFEKLLNETKDLEVAINFYLVETGGRDATLLEFTNFDKKKANELVALAKKSLPNTRQEWERKGNQPRYLIANKRSNIKNFSEAINGDDNALGKLLGYKCGSMGLGGKYTVVTYAEYNGKEIQITAEVCQEYPGSRNVDRLNSVAFKGLKFRIFIKKPSAFEYNKMSDFLYKNTNNIRVLYGALEEIKNAIWNLFAPSKISFLLDRIQSENDFEKFWETYKNILITLAILSDNTPLEPFFPLSTEQEKFVNNSYRKIEHDLLTKLN